MMVKFDKIIYELRGISHIILAAVWTSVASCNLPADIYDGFEEPELSKVWVSTRMAKGAFEIQSAVVRSGHYAGKMTLNAGDVSEPGSDRGLPTERDELRESKKLASTEGKLYQYNFSLFLPDSFPIVPVRLVIAQWKQYCGDDTCSVNNPVLAIRYVAGELYITVQTDTVKTTIFSTKEEVRNRWLDFQFKILFSRHADGQVVAWLNDKEIANYKGITCYSSARGYTEKGKYYFKTGIYRDLMAQPMTIYIDEYRKKELER